MLCRPTGANDTDLILFTLRVHNEDEASLNRPDGDEPVLFRGVGFIKYLQVLISTAEQIAGFLKGNAMLLPIRAVLGFIPDDPHKRTIVHGLSKSMA